MIKKIRAFLNTRLARLSIFTVAVAFAVWFVWYHFYPHKIQQYAYSVNAKIVHNGNNSEVKKGKNVVLRISEGHEASKTSTAHARWDTIYLQLGESMVMGEKLKPEKIACCSYWGRSNGWSIDPTHENDVVCEVLSIDSDATIEVRITGSVGLIYAENLRAKELEVESETGKKVNLRGDFTRTFTFKGEYVLEMKSVE